MPLPLRTRRTRLGALEPPLSESELLEEEVDGLLLLATLGVEVSEHDEMRRVGELTSARAAS